MVFLKEDFEIDLKEANGFEQVGPYKFTPDGLKKTFRFYRNIQVLAQITVIFNKNGDVISPEGMPESLKEALRFHSFYGRIGETSYSLSNPRFDERVKGVWAEFVQKEVAKLSWLERYFRRYGHFRVYNTMAVFPKEDEETNYAYEIREGTNGWVLERVILAEAQDPGYYTYLGKGRYELFKTF